MVEIIFFPKPCPACKKPLYVVKKFSGTWWWECRDEKCGYQS
jgi:uncharacterized protein YbaR (Trm112 family)